MVGGELPPRVAAAAQAEQVSGWAGAEEGVDQDLELHIDSETGQEPHRSRWVGTSQAHPAGYLVQDPFLGAGIATRFDHCVGYEQRGPEHVPENRKPRVRIHPVDAKHAGLADGDLATISSASGTIEMAALVTDEVSSGTVAIPHGWGHHGGWTRANAAGGSNTNLLVSTETADVEPLAGMSILVGIPIQIAKGGARARLTCESRVPCCPPMPTLAKTLRTFPRSSAPFGRPPARRPFPGDR